MTSDASFGEPLSGADSAEKAAGALLTVDLDAVAANYAMLKDAAAGAEVSAVVKADAYGLGMEPVAERLWMEGCRTFFVADAAEGAAPRAALPKAVIRFLIHICRCPRPYACMSLLHPAACITSLHTRTMHRIFEP